MIDSHCHLTDPRLRAQLDAVVARAQAAGVQRMITIATDVANARECVAVCQGRPELRCAVGVHPHEASGMPADGIVALRQIQDDPSVVAIGEIGLDYHYDFSPRDRQRAVFEAQLALAVELGRPVVIHCREAADDALAILRSQPRIDAVFHCFTGTTEEGARILDGGHLLGFTGVITFGKSEALRELVQATPLDRLLLETDAPYLAPEPMRRQKVNEPALVVYVANEVARVKGISADEVNRQTTRNTERFFGWLS